MKKEPLISYSFFKKKKVLLIAALSMGLLQLLLTVVYKDRGNQLLETLSDFGLIFKKLVIDWLLIEGLSVVILFYLTVRFQKFIAKKHPKSLKDTLNANLRYLPIILLSLFLFIPLAILLRHIWRNDFTIDGQRLLRQFRHFGRMYLEALLPFAVVGYAFFNINLNLQPGKKKTDQKGNSGVAKDGDFLEVINDNGNILIPVSQMLWIEKKDRIYEIKTAEKLYYVRKTLSELEDLLLPKGFIRINRSVIVNRYFVHNYSFWEYDKFILRMKDDDLTEFIVSRERMKQIKNQLSQTF